MMKDLVYDGSVFDHGDDLHLSMALGTKQGISFIDKFDQCGPGFFAFFDPITFGIFFTGMHPVSLIRR